MQSVTFPVCLFIHQFNLKLILDKIVNRNNVMKRLSSYFLICNFASFSMYIIFTQNKSEPYMIYEYRLYKAAMFNINSMYVNNNFVLAGIECTLTEMSVVIVYIVIPHTMYVCYVCWTFYCVR